MTTALTRPSRRDEAYRYADLKALEALWPPPAPERVVLGPGESWDHGMVHRGGLVRFELELGAGARADLRLLNLAAEHGRIEISATLGEGADLFIGAAQLGGGATTLEVVSEVRHLGRDATSNQLIRSVAGDSATVNCLAKVHVAPGADGTDAEQSLRAMLLDRTATANAKPELEIHADDVKAAHGCAIGELDAGALFYMAQRGLPPETAKRLMLQAFVAEAFAGARDEQALIAEAIEALEAML